MMIACPIMRRVLAAAVLGAVTLALAACTGGTSGPKGAFDHPAFGDRLVYISGVDGYLYALDQEFQGSSGEGGNDSGLLNSGWSQAVGDQRDPQPLIAGPALVDDPERPVVLVGSEDGNLYAYDALAGGDPLWVFRTGDKIWSTPVVKDGIAYFGSHDESVYAVNVGDGSQKWRFPTGGAVAGKPLVFRDMIVVGSFDKKLYALDAQTGAKQWELEGNNWFWAGAAANDNTIFAPNMDGTIYAVNGRGNLLWSCDMGSAIVSRPALIGGALAVAAKDGGVVVLLETNPNPDGSSGCPRELDRDFVSDDEIKAPLFVGGDSLYLGTDGGTVIRLDLSPPSSGRLGVRKTWCFDTETFNECQ